MRGMSFAVFFLGMRSEGVGQTSAFVEVEDDVSWKDSEGAFYRLRFGA